MEAPLLSIDDRLESFAQSHGLEVSRNYHNWPERSLKWNVSAVGKLIQIFLHEERDLTFTVWICASADRGKKRFWKQKRLREAVAIEEIAPDLQAILTEAKRTLDGWSETDLEPASG